MLATLRGALVGFEFTWPVVSRRLVVTIASMAVTASLWPLLRMLDPRPFWVKAVAIALGAFPASLLLAAVNQAAFADLEPDEIVSPEEGMQDIRIRRDEAGNVLVDLPQLPSPPAPPEPPAPGAAQAESGRETRVITSTGKDGKTARVIISDETDSGEKKWAALSDLASGRYFLLLAWAAIYLALVKGEQARIAERREGEHRRAAAAAELRSLRYQVNPHFLFNTLNSLSALVMTGKKDAAETMIQTLSSFYRRTLSGDPTGDSRLDEEMALQRLYLDVESVRFPNRLKCEIDVPDDLASALVPGMILQPLVENSVKYAVARSREPVTIAISARTESGWLIIDVRDDGPGVSEEAGHGFGIGLANVRDRLRARFGSDATLDTGPADGGGYRATLRMPLEFHRD